MKTLRNTILAVVLLIMLSNFWIIINTNERLYGDTRELIGAEVGLVLGTSKSLANGQPNPFFDNRMKAAAQLYQSGKVEKLLLSGSRDSVYYNEPEDMLKALIDLGVPTSKVIMDADGDRTLESLVRLKEVHGYKACIVVTQKYHAYRAVFLADHLGIEASCFIAASPTFSEHMKANLREVFARAKAVLDVYVIET